jgi:hypothetical protein
MRATRVWTVGLGVVLAAGAACGGHLNEVGQLNTQAGSGGAGDASSAAGTGAESGGAGAIAGAGAIVGVGAGGARGGAGGAVGIVSPGGGEGVIGPGSAGEAGETGVIDYPCDSGLGCIVANAGVISAVAADDSNVYWTEHGTVDDLGNYQNDGRLLRRAFDSTTTEVIATGLSGPVGLMLTTTDAYVYLDQVFDTSLRNALARVPLAGGDATIVQLDVQPVGGSLGACVVCGVHSGGTLYFPMANAIYEIASADAKPTLFTNFIAWSLAILGDNLIMAGGMDDQHQSQIWTIPLTGGTPQLVVDPGSGYFIQPAGDNFYAVDNCGDAYCLCSMPQTGGPWTHLPNPWSGSSDLEISGNLFFHDAIGPDQSWQMYQGTLTDPSTAVVLFSLPGSTARGWVGTTAGVFWVDFRTLRLRTNDVQ